MTGAQLMRLDGDGRTIQRLGTRPFSEADPRDVCQLNLGIQLRGRTLRGEGRKRVLNRGKINDKLSNDKLSPRGS